MKKNWYKGPGYPYFITNTVVDWMPVFVNSFICEIVLESFIFFQTQKAVSLLGYVIMPSHLHYIVFPQKEDYIISDMQRDFKKRLSKRVIKHLQFSRINDFYPYVNLYRQNNLRLFTPDKLLSVFEKYGHRHNQSYKVWQTDDNPVAIESEKFFLQKLNYLHQNPVKEGWVERPEEFPFSSARNYYLDDNQLIRIDKNI